MLQRSGRALDLPIGAIRNGRLLEGDRRLPQPHGLATASVRPIRFASPRASLRTSRFFRHSVGGTAMRRLRLETTTYGELKPAVEDVADQSGPAPPTHTPGREDRWTIRRSALSRQLVLDAQAVFTRRLRRPVSENEARNMLGNLADYLWMLVQWEVTAADPPADVKEKNQSARPRDRPKKSDHVKRKPSRRPPPA